MIVKRCLVYEGPEEWIRQTIRKSYITPEGRRMSQDKGIKEEWITELHTDGMESPIEIEREDRAPYIQMVKE